jgi:hypothetical protein
MLRKSYIQPSHTPVRRAYRPRGVRVMADRIRTTFADANHRQHELERDLRRRRSSP